MKTDKFRSIEDMFNMRVSDKVQIFIAGCRLLLPT